MLKNVTFKSYQMYADPPPDPSEIHKRAFFRGVTEQQQKKKNTTMQCTSIHFLIITLLFLFHKVCVLPFVSRPLKKCCFGI